MIFIRLCLSESLNIYRQSWCALWSTDMFMNYYLWAVLSYFNLGNGIFLFFPLFHLKLFQPTLLQFVNFFDYKHSFMSLNNAFWLKMGVEFYVILNGFCLKVSQQNEKNSLFLPWIIIIHQNSLKNVFCFFVLKKS